MAYKSESFVGQIGWLLFFLVAIPLMFLGDCNVKIKQWLGVKRWF